MVESVSKIYQDFKSMMRQIIPSPIWLRLAGIKNYLCEQLESIFEWGNFKAQWFKADNFAHYQPLPWIGKRSFKRDESTFERWEAIKKEIDIKNGSALDIGSNLGFFALRLSEMGFYSIGIDMKHGFKVISEYAQKKAGIGNAAFSTMALTPDNISSLPVVDITLFLSVWHHWIKHYGYEKAKIMFEVLWRKTNHVMFVESGEDSEIKRLNIKEEPSVWIRKELESICSGGSIKILGTFDKGAHKKKRDNRTLFAVFKN